MSFCKDYHRRDIGKRNMPNAMSAARINTNKILMKTYKEFISILEKFKPFPEDKVNKQIDRKKKRGNNIGAHQLNVAKNYNTKLSNKTNTDGIKNTKSLYDRLPKHTNNSLTNMLQGNHKKSTENIKRIKGLETHAFVSSRAKPDDVKAQISHNQTNKENKKKLNKLYKNEN